MTDDNNDPTTSIPVFRASKRRKMTYDQGQNNGHTIRSHTEQGDPEKGSWSALTEDTVEREKAEPSAVNQALRLRAASRARRRGVGVESSGPASSGSHSLSTIPEPKQISPGGVLAPIDNRFAAQSGKVELSTNGHMNAYIEGELAKAGAASSISPLGGPHISANPAPMYQTQDLHPSSATNGHLDVIDLREDSHADHLSSSESTDRNVTGSLSSGTRSFGRIGNAKRPQKRMSRNIGDSRRDELVEAVLREHTVGMFDDTGNAPRSGGIEQFATDDMLAEEFEKEYLETVRDQQLPKKPPGPQSGPKDLTRGPKLGGSRSARAAMHAQDRAAATKKR